MSEMGAEAKLTLSFLKLLQQTGQVQGFDPCRKAASGPWSHTTERGLANLPLTWVTVTGYYSVMGS